MLHAKQDFAEVLLIISVFTLTFSLRIYRMMIMKNWNLKIYYSIINIEDLYHVRVVFF